MHLLGGATWAELEKKIQQDTSATGRSVENPSKGDDAMTAANVLIDLLGVDPSDFSPDIPLRSYGLDSLGATRLAAALKPYMDVTQLQLMGETTWTELLAKLPRDSMAPDPPLQPLVKICDKPGTPLIILPGINGSATAFLGLRRYFHGSLWALQVTEATPLESGAALVSFWKQRICEEHPHGPYRFAAYSASSVLGVALTKLMEDAGEEVTQLTFIDHCPILWTREGAELLLREKTAEEFRQVIDDTVLDMLRNDPAIGLQAFTEYEAALPALPDATAIHRREVNTTRAISALLFKFLRQFYPTDHPKSLSTFIEPFKAWVLSIKAPLAVLVAGQGMVYSAPGGSGAWPDLGAEQLGKLAKVHYVNGVGHYGLFKNERVAQILEL
jgi:thioesterase domain-containing protein/aryl carrier-like protein